MSTIVCQNITSHFDSETTATLNLKVAAPPPPPPETLNWGFNFLQTNPKDQKEDFYTHYSSYQKPSFSLELCTENLGSETGSDLITGSNIFSTSMLPLPLNTRENDATSFTRVEARKVKDPRHKSSFPPPLTSMIGSLQVRRRRDGGRLIIEAVEAPFRNSYLQAERCDGRLKLCFLRSCGAAETRTPPASAAAVKNEDENVNENEDECDGEMVAEEEIVGPTRGDESARDKELINSEINSEINCEINSEIINCEIGIEKFKWIGRCKENGHGNKGLCNNWKPALWVATS